MTTIAVRFLAGRFHATPWGRHVNEGVPEWPPSPWRLLRALVATCKRTLPAATDEELAGLLTALAAPPLIALPPASPAHTRHYMPWFKKGPDDKTLVFDTFAATNPSEPVRFTWPDSMFTSQQEELLSAILRNMSYLGRAESWCEASLDRAEVVPNCHPLSEGGSTPAGTVAVPVLTADPTTPDLLGALMVETGELRSKQRQLLSAGSRWVRYSRPVECLVDHPRRPIRPVTPSPSQAIRFALTGKPLPLLTDAIRIGEELCSAVRITRSAYFLPEDLDGDGRIDHLAVWSPEGLAAADMERLGRVRALRRSGDRELSLFLLGSWNGEELSRGDLGRSSIWESATPFVLSRHPRVHKDGSPKLNELGEQQDGPAEQLRQALAAARPDLPAILEVTRLDGHRLAGGRTLRWLEYHRWRSWGADKPTGTACGFRVRFATPVAGPLAVGYGRHFGLGQFRPVE